MSSYKVEYLLVISSKEIFCKSIDAFNSLVQSYDNIKVKGNSIEFDGVSFGYYVQYGEIKKDSERFFHVKFTCEKNNNTEKFKLFLKSFRTILSKASGKPPEILWDDISSELSNKAYPIIHELENMMRKLITKFMLITIGLEWTKDAIPKEVFDSIKLKNSYASQNYLYESDFIQLSNFLFKEYSISNSRKIIEKVSSALDLSDLELVELKELVPQSNWERYFSPIVDCNSEYLQTRWNKLYDFRCIVAHNKFMCSEDFDSLKVIAAEVRIKLIEALENLDKVHIREEQKEGVAESIASNINALYGEFIISWNTLQELLINLYDICNNERGLLSIQGHSPKDIKERVKVLVEEEVLTKNFSHAINELNDIRNAVVHHSTSKIEDIKVINYIKVLEVIKLNVINKIENYQTNKP